MNQAIHSIMTELASTLDSLTHGGKGAEVSRVAESLDWSASRVYNHLKKVGWSSGRKKRADAGKTSVEESVLVDMSTTIRSSMRANGKILMDVPNATSMLAANGRDIKVSNGQMRRLLSQRSMNAANLKKDSAHTSMRSLHPNHVHQVDPSYCVLYYLPKSTTGQFMQRIAADDEHYQNKPQNIEKNAVFRVWRYVLTDHFSSTIQIRYFQSAGETYQNLYEFLLYCWSRQTGNPFHGVPKILVWDLGSANTSAPIKNALEALEVTAIPHKTKNARAKGQVENANNLVEKGFESRLRFEPVSSVEELNDAAERWCNAYNANAIPHYDSRLNRRGMTEPQARFSLWQMIREEQLRILPDIALCKALLTSKAETRKVSKSLTITFKHSQAKKSLTYDLRDLPEVYPGATVRVSVLVYGDCEVKITVTDYKGEEQSFHVAPLVFDDLSGFRIDAPVIGEEFDSRADTLLDINQKAADRNAFPAANDKEIEKLKKNNAAPFGGLDAHSHLADVYKPSYMQRPGVVIEVGDVNRIETKPLTVLEACKKIRSAIGRPLTPEDNKLIRSLHPQGVPLDEFDQLLLLIKNPAPTIREASLSLIK